MFFFSLNVSVSSSFRSLWDAIRRTFDACFVDFCLKMKKKLPSEQQQKKIRKNYSSSLNEKKSNTVCVPMLCREESIHDWKHLCQVEIDHLYNFKSSIYENRRRRRQKLIYFIRRTMLSLMMKIIMVVFIIIMIMMRMMIIIIIIMIIIMIFKKMSVNRERGLDIFVSLLFVYIWNFTIAN